MYTKKSKRLVLGEGAAAGHKHVLESKQDINYAELEGTISLPFLLAGTGVLTHDEHDRIVLPATKYRRYHQVEFNPLDGSTSRVFD